MSLLQHTPRLSGCAPRFPNRIRRYRLQAGLTQRALAALLRQRRSSVSAWERGRHLPNVTSLFRLARSLDTLTESLYWDLYTQVRREGKTPERS